VLNSKIKTCRWPRAVCNAEKPEERCDNIIPLSNSPFLKPGRVGIEIGFTDPVYRKRFRRRHGADIEEDIRTAAADWSTVFIPGMPHNWDNLRVLREHWKDPIVVKGHQSVENAQAGFDRKLLRRI
jgi:isopentenyl diphosphate isomerase/L-lactate dehydrogenase-like FMN-dependent dehydrogenase